MTGSDTTLLDALLDSWDRNNRILVNLLRLVPANALALRPAEGSMTIAGLFLHMHYCRLIFVQENVSDLAHPLPEGEWRQERDPARIAAWLDESALVFREAVRSRIESGRAMERYYDHPVLMLQHFIWHEGYHHGQIKLALKQAGMPLGEEEAGAVTWDVFMDKTAR
jgi:uncharacterized damage-inducible protein DinB